jgi:PKD repeat protein
MGTVVVSRENRPPVAAFTWAPLTPKANQTITFDASASYNPDGSITLYEWDWNNDSTYDDSYHTPIATKAWTQAGNYPVTVRVSDNDGVTSTKTITIPISSGETPGFELVFVIGAIALALFLWKKKRIV